MRNMRNNIQRLTLCACLLALGLPALAQQPKKIQRIGLLTWAGPPAPSSPTPFNEGLRKLSYVEGQNIAIEPRYANGQMNRLPELAVDLVRQSPDVIVAQSYPAALAAKQATTTIPIVIM